MMINNSPTSSLPDSAEEARLAALKRYEILDTPADGAFDGITALVAKFLDVPIAIASLVDEDRIWFKSHHGIDVEQVERAPGLCASAILRDVPYVINDAGKDPRSFANPLVAGELGLRFYAAVPLKTHDGHKLGTLCAIDVSPRGISDEEIEVLSTLAKVIMDEMELRLAAREIARKNIELKNLIEEKNRLLGMAAHDMRGPLGVILNLSDFLETEAFAALDEEQREFVTTIKETSGFMLRMVTDLLDVAAIEAGQLNLDRQQSVSHSRLSRAKRRAEASGEKTSRALQRLTEAQRIGRMGDWEWDFDSQRIDWSPQVFEILGRDSALGPPKDREEHASLYDDASVALMNEKIDEAIGSGAVQEYTLTA